MKLTVSTWWGCCLVYYRYMLVELHLVRSRLNIVYRKLFTGEPYT